MYIVIVYRRKIYSVWDTRTGTKLVYIQTDNPTPLGT